jgi:hypothetical protein
MIQFQPSFSFHGLYSYLKARRESVCSAVSYSAAALCSKAYLAADLRYMLFASTVSLHAALVISVLESYALRTLEPVRSCS